MATSTSESLRIYPFTLAGAHGRIAAYRAALETAAAALTAAVPYVHNVECDHANSPWRRETAVDTMGTIQKALIVVNGELDA